MEVKALNVSASAISQIRINQDPYGKGWIFKIELEEKPPAGSLLDAAGYEELISEEHE